MITEPGNLILAGSLLLTAILFVGLSIPLIKRNVKMNSLYGIRFKKAFESDAAWYDINEYGGKVLGLSGIPLGVLGLLSLFIDLDAQPLVTLVIAFAPAIIALVGAYLCWRFIREYDVAHA